MAIDLQEMQALDLWRRAVVTTVAGDAPDLSGRQIAVLLTVYLTPPPHTAFCVDDENVAHGRFEGNVEFGTLNE